MKKIIIPILMLVVLASCIKPNNNESVVEGYKPVYISKDNAFKIAAQSPASFVNPGKMFLYQNYIFITDNGEGVHILDNSDPSNPKKIAFVSIPGVVDAAVKNGVLFADNFTDIVSIDISDMNNISLKKRIKNVYSMENQLYPAFATGYFECADTTKGYVLRWEKTNITNPKCYR